MSVIAKTLKQFPRQLVENFQEVMMSRYGHSHAHWCHFDLTGAELHLSTLWNKEQTTKFSDWRGKEWNHVKCIMTPFHTLKQGMCYKGLRLIEEKCETESTAYCHLSALWNKQHTQQFSDWWKKKSVKQCHMCNVTFQHLEMCLRVCYTRLRLIGEKKSVKQWQLHIAIFQHFWIKKQTEQFSDQRKMKCETV